MRVHAIQLLVDFVNVFEVFQQLRYHRPICESEQFGVLTKKHKRELEKRMDMEKRERKRERKER